MSDARDILLVIANPSLRESVMSGLDDVDRLYAVFDGEAEEASELTDREPKLILFDSEGFSTLPVAERRLLKQAGIESLVVLAEGQSPYADGEDVAALTDFVHLPIEPRLLDVRIERALEIFSMRSDMGFSKRNKPVDAPATETGRIRQQIEEERTRAQDLERLKSNLITIISHEFKTPLHLASGYITLLLDGSLGDLPEEQRKAMQTVERQVSRLSDKLADIERIAQLEMGLSPEHAESVDLVVLLKQEIEGFEEGIAKKNLDIDTDFERNLPTVLGSRDFLADVFRRLIDNAIHYTDRGGKATLRAFSEESDGKRMVTVEVTDTGCGIPPALKKHIFDRFGEFRDIEHHSSRRSGLGLGLAICRHLVEIHEGEISVDSEVGEGSTFRVRIPAEG